MDRDHIVIGQITKVRGIQGEVVVRVTSDVPDRYEGLEGVLIVEPDGRSTYREVESLRQLQSDYLIKFGGISDRRVAKETLVGRSLAVSRDQVPPPGEDESYHFELVGLEVVRSDGGLLGKLESIIETGANDVYVVRGPEGEVLIPATREVIERVDVEIGRMTVRPLPGLFDRDEETAPESDEAGETGR
jgi:16S rRNA processing protein RimM